MRPVATVLQQLSRRSADGPQVPAARVPLRLHRHRYRGSAEDPFSGSSLYACRCGVVRPGL